MITYHSFACNPLGTLCYVVADEASRQCAIVDPGMLYPNEHAAIDRHISSAGLTPVAIWQTHLHFDHCWGTAALVARYGIPVFASADDEFLLSDNGLLTSAWGLPAPERFRVDHHLSDGQHLQLGQSDFVVITSPGHTPGGVSFYSAEGNVCFTGDTIFRFSVGRTDFPRGDSAALVHSVRSKILTLPEQTILLPGHGDPTRVSDEIVGNPYINQYD